MMDDKYFWSHKSSLKLDEWLQKTRPSIITDDETPWIWLRGSTSVLEDPERSTEHGEALTRAQKILSRLSTRLEEIQQDESIPVRGKKGTKSKKQVKEEAHETAREELQELSVDSKWTLGKWLFFPSNSTVDAMWSTLARSVADGPLKSAGVDLVKVAPAPRATSEGEMPTQVICLYMDNVYDKPSVTKILEVLLKEHGLEPSACKSDLYTLAGIDSKHPTGLRSSIWRAAELIEGGGAAIKKMKEEHRSKKEESGDGKISVGPDGMIESDSEDERVMQAAKRKPENKAESSASLPKIPPPKKAKTAAMRYKEEDIFAAADDSD